MTGRELLRVERMASVAVLRFDRPPANALDLGAIELIGQTIRELGASDDVRGVVLTGAGSYFCAGLDLKALATYSREQQRILVQRVNEMVAAVYSAPVPLVAAINGHALAGGLVYALLCEHRLAAQGTFHIGLSEVRLGIPFPASSLEVIKAELTASAVRRLVLAGAYLDPRSALAVGIVDELVPPDQLLDRAVEVAKEVGSMPREGYARIKSQVRGAIVARLREIEAGGDPMLDEWMR